MILELNILLLSLMLPESISVFDFIAVLRKLWCVINRNVFL